jgi:hypothetical protein
MLVLAEKVLEQENEIAERCGGAGSLKPILTTAERAQRAEGEVDVENAGTREEMDQWVYRPEMLQTLDQEHRLKDQDWSGIPMSCQLRSRHESTSEERLPVTESGERLVYPAGAFGRHLYASGSSAVGLTAHKERLPWRMAIEQS